MDPSVVSPPSRPSLFHQDDSVGSQRSQDELDNSAPGSYQGQATPLFLRSPASQSIADSEAPTVSTIAAPGGWHHHERHQPETPSSPKSMEMPYTAASPPANPLVDLVAAGAHAYRALGIGSASSLSGSTASSGRRWESGSESASEDHDVLRRRTPRESERRREKARAVESAGEEPLPTSPPHRSSRSRHEAASSSKVELQARGTPEDHMRRSARSEQQTKRRHRRVHHYYYYTADKKYQERGFSRDFFLIVWLCLGIACFIILIGRSVRAQTGGLDFEAGL